MDQKENKQEININRDIVELLFEQVQKISKKKRILHKHKSYISPKPYISLAVASQQINWFGDED